MPVILQDAIVIPPHVAFALRPNPGIWEFAKVNSDDLSVESISATEYLKFKEMVVDENWYVQVMFSLFVFIFCGFN